MEYTMSDRHYHLLKTPSAKDLRENGYIFIEWVCPVCKGKGSILALTCKHDHPIGWKPLADVDGSRGTLPCGCFIKDASPADIACPNCSGRKLERHRVTLKGLAQMIKELNDR